MTEQQSLWGEHTNRAAGFLLHLSIFLALFAVVLWPSSSYVSFFRYGNVPILYEFAAFVLPLAVALGSAYLGVLTRSPRLADARGIAARFGSEVLGAVCTVAVTAPIVVIAGSVSRASAISSGQIVLILTTTALLFRPVGLLTQAITANRSVQYVLMWGFVILAFYLSAYWLPVANPVVGITNAAGATRIGGTSIFFIEIDGYRSLVTAGYHIVGAGFLTILVVLSGHVARRRGGATP